MASLNRVTLLGRLGKDPEIRYTQDKNPVCIFSLATSESWVDQDGNKKENTEWHSIVVWGKQAEPCRMYLSKGKQVLVEGAIQSREWVDKEGVKRRITEIKASSVKFLGERQPADMPLARNGAKHQMAITDVDLDAIPF